MRINSKNQSTFDVCILGTGISGTLLAAILARHGVRVLMIEEKSHPRFAIGESTIPECTGIMAILADRYSVPEIDFLSTFQKARQHVSSACGIKRNFSFVFHRENEEQRPTETTQFLTWAPPFGPDIHLFRQDVDAYMLAVAVRYGAVVRQQTRLLNMQFDKNGVNLETSYGQKYQASYVVDASGYKSLLAQIFNLRETPCAMKTQSRTLFTHMVGVKSYDECVSSRNAHGLPSPFCQGTLHHIFDGGWMWVIPFNNHRASTNPLCSVGLNFDLRRYPQTGSPPAPEQEFRMFLSRYPSIAKQFENARPVREWVTSGRLQYASKQVVGDRFCLMPHSAGFVDALFSSGLSMTVATINVLAHRLVTAVRDNDFSTERFSYVEVWMKINLNYYDRLVNCSYTAFSHFELWNAWQRVWMIGSLFGMSGFHEVHGKFIKTGDPSFFSEFEQYPYRGLQAIDLKEYAELFNKTASEVEAVQNGSQSPVDASKRIYDLLRDSELRPTPWHLLNSSRRFPATLTLIPMMRLLFWGRFRSSPVVRKYYFTSGTIGGFLPLLWKCLAREFRASSISVLGLIRDCVYSWNKGWTVGSHWARNNDTRSPKITS